ncbi:hypothetical protein SAMN05216276_103425 [Streptosporangium subroseum]|uniref:Uncharacterized protein n=1 Tax=Streptosporangium subroseum TaxID=106412 RepID=A0A239LMN7_9ACTN|nr:hypothetical protein [Streptosporangium subroseum]SNT31836.1 hypothetical protein SAMN05216276_103425 [Streptosporangium subroseum]
MVDTERRFSLNRRIAMHLLRQRLEHGITDTSTCATPSAAISATRSSALSICGPDAFTTGRRNRSSMEILAPAGTSRSSAGTRRRSPLSSPCRVSHRRVVAFWGAAGIRQKGAAGLL